MDISAEIAAIQAASQGSELRQPLVGALNKLNSGSLPAVTASDAGKILKVGANGWEVGEKSGYMPVPVNSLNISSNDTYDVTNYAEVIVNVPQSGITQADEGKVVSNGILVAQTAKTPDITQNGTYDTTLNNEVVVNVPSGSISGVFKNTSAPSSSVGNDGDIYIQNVELPSSINFVEHLTSSGTQYIDTGIVADQNTQAYIHFKTVASGPDGGVFGARQARSSRQFCIVQSASTNKIRFDYAATSNELLTLSANTEYKFSLGKLVLNENGMIYSFGGAMTSFTTPGNIYLFGMNNNGAPAINNGTIVYRFTIRQSGIIIADFIPALDGDGIPCMYEAVSGTFKYNAGSGTFTYGNAATHNEACTVYQKQDGMWNVLTQIEAA